MNKSGRNVEGCQERWKCQPKRKNKKVGYNWSLKKAMVLSEY